MSLYLAEEFDLNQTDLVSVIDELPLWSAPFGLKLLEFIKLRKNITALDIGFGLGFPLTEIAQRLGNTSKIYGIDPWEQAVERTKLKIKKYNITNIELILGHAEDIPLESNSIDLIISNNGINNVDNLDKTLNECSRIAKKNAQLVFTGNLETTMFEFYQEYKNILTKKNLTESLKRLNEHIASKRMPLSALTEKIEKNGFKINHIDENQFYYRYVDGTTMLNHFLIRIAFLESWLNILNKEQQKPIFELLEKRLNQIADEQNGFKLTVPFVTIDSTYKAST